MHDRAIARDKGPQLAQALAFRFVGTSVKTVGNVERATFVDVVLILRLEPSELRRQDITRKRGLQYGGRCAFKSCTYQHTGTAAPMGSELRSRRHVPQQIESGSRFAIQETTPLAPTIPFCENEQQATYSASIRMLALLL